MTDQAAFVGEVAWPRTMRLPLEQESTVQAAVSLEPDTVPPEVLIDHPADDTGTQQVVVGCAVSARLSGGADVQIEHDGDTAEGGWVLRTFGPVSAVEWAWAVTPMAPRTQQLRLELRPTMLVDDGALVQPIPAGNVTTYTSTVTVEADRVARMAHWWDTQGVLLQGMLGTLGVAILAVLGWWGKVLAATAPWRSRRSTQRSSPAPPERPEQEGPQLPPALASLAERLEGAGFTMAAKRSSAGFGDRVVDYRTGHTMVRFVRDRGQWSLLVSPNRGRDWFDVDIWSAVLRSRRAPIEPAPLQEQARALDAALPQITRAAKGSRSGLVGRLRDAQEDRSARRLERDASL